MKPLDLLFHEQTDEALAKQQGLSDYLLLRLGERVYGVSIEEIVEIIRFTPPTIVPRTPERILGIVSLRGTMLTVIDVREQLDVERVQPTSSGKVIVLRDSRGDTVGVYVDEVLRVARVPKDRLEPPENALGSEIREHVQGLVRTPTLTFVVLSFAPLLD